MLYVAVVVSRNGTPSRRPKGDWACFTGENKQAVIDEALEATEEWNRGGWGPYKVLVGRLTLEAQLPERAYSLVPLLKASLAEAQRKKAAVEAAEGYLPDCPWCYGSCVCGREEASERKPKRRRAAVAKKKKVVRRGKR